MKKVLFAAFAVMAFGVSNAQDIKFGAKVGLNVATLNGDLEDAKSLIGAHLGAFAEIKITDKFAFQPELLYSMQGAKSEYSESETGYSYSSEDKYKLGYLNLPLMAKYFATEKLFIEAGPQIGFLMSAKNDYKETETILGETETFSGDVDIKDDFKSIDFGFNFGLGYEFTQNVFASARYNVGLSDINDDGSNVKIQNGVLQFSVGYKF
jgi:hypothetical protein